MNTVKGTLFFLSVLLSPITAGMFVAMAPHILFGTGAVITAAWALVYFVIWISTWEWMKSKGWHHLI